MTPLEKKRDELAETFVRGYVTMNNRPPHRPDVLQHSFLSGFDAAVKVLAESAAAKDADIEHWRQKYGRYVDKWNDKNLECEQLKAGIKVIAEQIPRLENEIGWADRELKDRATKIHLWREQALKLKTALEYYAKGECHSCAIEYGAPKETYDLPDTSDREAAERTLSEFAAFQEESE